MACRECLQHGSFFYSIIELASTAEAGVKGQGLVLRGGEEDAAAPRV